LRFLPLPFASVRINAGFWAKRQEVNGSTTVPAGHDQLEQAGAFENFRSAARRGTGQYHGPVYEDGEVYKWLEAVAWELARRPRAQLATWVLGTVPLVAAAQDDDGYLNTFVQVAAKGSGRFADLAFNHEIFNVGALAQAAVALARTGAGAGLLDVARRAASQINETFGPGKAPGTCGHPLIEMALVELSRHTGDRTYLELSRHLIAQRGKRVLSSGRFGPSYFSDRVPVREATSLEGHAVRALYLACGATDLATETDDEQLLAAVKGQWASTVSSKAYITGGLGARWDGEAFGDAYELPPDRAYCETCAAVASVQWAWRLLLKTGDPDYAELIERTLYNGVLPGVSLSGDRFFYVNTLRLRAEAAQAGDDAEPPGPANGRRPWFATSCCPTNLMRMIASLHHYFVSGGPEGVQLHQYASMSIDARAVHGPSRLEVETNYPWDGEVCVRLGEALGRPWELALRVPQWAGGASLRVNGRAAGPEPVPGTYTRLFRNWEQGDEVVLELPVKPRRSRPSPEVDAVRGCVALEMGPFVYCLEQHDQPARTPVDELWLGGGSLRAAARPDLLGGITVIKANGVVRRSTGTAPLYKTTTGEETVALSNSAPAARADDAGVSSELTAVPYYAWANRGPAAMRVWVPEQ